MFEIICSKKFIASPLWNFCLRDTLRSPIWQIQAGPQWMSGWRTTCSLLQLISCHLKTIPHTWQPYCPHNLHLHYPAKLSHVAGDVNDTAQGLEAEGMQTFLERMNWSDLSLVFPSLVPSAGEGLGLGREEATSGTAWIFARERRRNSEPRNQEVGRLHRTQAGRKKHWEKNSAYLRARRTWVFWLNLKVMSILVEFLLQKWRGESCTHC